MENNLNNPYNAVDPKSPIPLYYQIYLDLRKIIQQEIIPPGGMLPPEVEISQMYDVGRQTVRHAIARLVDENFLERFPGRGTFVKDNQNFIKFLLDRSFSQQMRELGMEPKSDILSTETSIVSADQIPALQRWVGSPCLILERLRLGNNQPICHQLSIILIDKCPDLQIQDFSNHSLYEILSSHYHIIINKIDNRVRATAADEYRADLLNIQKDAPLLYVGTMSYADDGHLMEYTTSYYRADRYEFITSQACCSD